MATDSRQCDDRQRPNAAECREIAHHFFEPERPELIGQIVGVAECQQHHGIEPVGFFPQHLVGHAGKEIKAECSQAERNQ